MCLSTTEECSTYFYSNRGHQQYYISEVETDFLLKDKNWLSLNVLPVNWQIATLKRPARWLAQPLLKHRGMCEPRSSFQPGNFEFDLVTGKEELFASRVMKIDNPNKKEILLSPRGDNAFYPYAALMSVCISEEESGENVENF